MIELKVIEMLLSTLLISDSTESPQQRGGEHVERAELSSCCGALWGCEGGPPHCALHGLKARWTFFSTNNNKHKYFVCGTMLKSYGVNICPNLFSMFGPASERDEHPPWGFGAALPSSVTGCTGTPAPKEGPSPWCQRCVLVVDNVKSLEHQISEFTALGHFRSVESSLHGIYVDSRKLTQVLFFKLH